MITSTGKKTASMPYKKTPISTHRHRASHLAQKIFCDVCTTRLGAEDWEQYKPLSHHRTYSGLVDAARRGCPICCHVWARISRVAPSDPSNSQLGAIQELRQPVTTQHSIDPLPAGTSLQAHGAPDGDREDTDGFLTVCQLSRGPVGSCVEITFRLPRSPGDFERQPLRFPFSLRPADDVTRLFKFQSRSTGSLATFHIAQGWLSNCQQNHSRCRYTARRGWHPTRLIDVTRAPFSRPDKIRLVQRAEGETGSDEAFATLSHCWGAAKFVQLRRSNIQEFKTVGILLQRLPQTFQDAILTCRRLNIRYVWIDSLCIIQDCPADWAKESSRMAKIYSRCSLNIAALASQDSSQGLFRNRTLGMAPADAKISVSHVSEHGRWRGKHHAFYEGDWTDNVEGAPLNSRGWVFQECLLSPRILGFGGHQIYWECREETAREVAVAAVASGFPDEFEVSSKRWFSDVHLEAWKRDNERKRWSASLVHGWSPPPSLGPRGSRCIGDFGLTSAHRTWYEVVRTYTKRSLTRQTDVLVALSGLARVFSSILHDDLYLAGMWENSLEADLLWIVGDLHATNRSLEAREQEEYLAPSFCWASAGGRYEIVHEWFLHDHLREAICFEVCGLQIEHDPAGKLDNLMGAVKGGYLDIRAKVKPMRMRTTGLAENDVLIDPGETPNLHLHEIDLEERSTDYGHYFRTDRPISEQMRRQIDDGRVFYYVTAYHYEEQDPDFHPAFYCFWLLLDAVDQSQGIYRRIGSGIAQKRTGLAERLSDFQDPDAVIPNRGCDGDMYTIRIV